LSGCVEGESEVEVTLVDVSGTIHSGDAILIQFQDDTVILIDTGFDGYTRSHLIPLLEDRKINRIDNVVITHAHRNHYGGLVALIESGIQVNNIYFNLPARAACDRENWSTGCDWEYVATTRRKLESLGVAVRSAGPGHVFHSDPILATRLEVLFAFDGAITPVGATDINDTSLIMRLDVGKNSILLTGDLNSRLGSWLADQEFDFKATVLKAPHHGIESAAPNKFLRMVDPEIVLVPVSTGHWLSDRGKRMRELFADKPVFVNGIHGHITLRLTEDDYLVQTRKIR
jgi:competence protein ComEC